MQGNKKGKKKVTLEENPIFINLGISFFFSNYFDPPLINYCTELVNKFSQKFSLFTRMLRYYKFQAIKFKKLN